MSGDVSGVDPARVVLRAALEAARKNSRHAADVPPGAPNMLGLRGW
ncbi:hypothetical protein ABT121_34525 [Streptomyces sp. NPDC001928]